MKLRGVDLIERRVALMARVAAVGRPVDVWRRWLRLQNGHAREHRDEQRPCQSRRPSADVPASVLLLTARAFRRLEVEAGRRHEGARLSGPVGTPQRRAEGLVLQQDDARVHQVEGLHVGRQTLAAELEHA